MILRNLRTKTIEAATPAALDAAILAFTQVQQEWTYLSIHYQLTYDGNGTALVYSVLIAYTE